MLARLRRLSPLVDPGARRLAGLFAIVYFAQGMWYLPNQVLTVVLKERGLSAGQVADFFFISTIPWLIKPVYGLVSDFVPLFGRRRKSYLLLTSSLAAASGFALALGGVRSYAALAGLFTAMALGLAFTDVLVDAVMVESGKTQVASALVGEVGGYMAERRSIDGAFFLAALFPLISLAMTGAFVHEP